MKKVMMIAAIAAALVSCQSKGTQNNDSTVDEGVLTVAGNDSSAVAVYEGLLPAADGPGIQYVLSVDSVGPDGESRKKTFVYGYGRRIIPGNCQHSFTYGGIIVLGSF